MFYGSQPLAKYSDTLNQASFIEDDDDNDDDDNDNNDNDNNSFDKNETTESMPRKTSKSRKGKKRVKSLKGIKFSSGRLLLRVPGYGLQRLAPSDLVRFIPSVKLRSAAKKVLRLRGISRTKKSRRKGGRKRRRKQRKS